MVETVTPQALMLMNSRFVHEYAEDFARRIQKEAGADVRAQIALAWRWSFAEEASKKDIDDAAAFIAEQTARFRAQPKSAEPEVRALANFCQALLSANPFLYVD